MAKQGELQAQPEAEAHLEKTSKKKVVLIGLAALLLFGGGAGAWLLLSAGTEHEAKHEPAPAARPVFVTLEPFVVNLAGDAQHYVQVGIDLKVAESTVPDRVKEHMPEVRNAVLLLLSAKTPEDLATVDGKHTLRREVRAAINSVLGVAPPAGSPGPAEATAQPVLGEAHAAPPATPAPGVNQAKDEVARTAAEESGREGVLQVLFTSFVIQ